MIGKMIPALWLRLIVVIAFTIVVGWQQMWIITVVGAVLVVMTAYQLYMAYQQSDRRP